MGNDRRGLVRRLVDSLIGLLPDGGIGNEGPAPDVDGKRDSGRRPPSVRPRCEVPDELWRAGDDEL